jgi:hypothetical protein
MYQNAKALTDKIYDDKTEPNVILACSEILFFHITQLYIEALEKNKQ